MSQMSVKNTMAEVEKFKSAIPRVRDILRSCSITGMDSMRHICLYLLSRYITNENVSELNIPNHLSWENIFIKSFEDEDIALQLFKHDLIDQSDKLFGTQQFSFEMKSGVKHKEILEIFNSVSMKNIDLHMDILGYVYEQHLKTGSTAARDLGQFFTDRFICEYMVKICQPKFKINGIPESVCDPTMGTGGFITAYLKYFKDNNVDWSKYQNQVHGVDHDAKVAGVSRLNMFMESRGEVFKHLHTSDSLHGGLNPTSYDIILANMPFGLKGLKYADVHQSIKNLHIDGTKSEPLFLQLMMVSLNKGGRCAVVVPDGMLVNNSKCHNGTRKYLLENFELKRVIKMKGKFFMNTGIQPSIIFFENSGKKTEQVEFWDVERDDKGNFTEKVVVSVPVEKFDESYSLDMRKYQETVKKDYNEEFPIVKLGDICKVSFGARITQKDNKGTLYPVYGSGGNTFNTDRFNRSGLTCKIGRFALSEDNMVMFVNGPYWLLDSGFTVESNSESLVLTKFLWYLMLLDKKRLCNISTGSCQKNIDMTEFYKLEYPIPSLELQTQIVEELDAIHESKQNASKMIENLKKQMKSIMNAVNYTKNETYKLSEFYEQPKGIVKFNASDIDNEGNIPFYSAKWDSPVGVHSKESYTSDEPYFVVIKSGGGDHNSDKVGLGMFFNVSGSCAVTLHTLILKQKERMKSLLRSYYDHKYIYYYMKYSVKELRDKAKKSINLEVLSINDILDFEIKCPDVFDQEKIVERLDKLQDQITCLEQIETQADENAKFILDSYLNVN